MRVVVLGTGQMGSAIVADVLGHPDLTLVGVVARRPERAGLDAAALGGLDTPTGVVVENDLAAVLARTRPDAVVQATTSTLDDAKSEIETCLRRGVNVVSIAEEMVWPAAFSPERARALDALAVAGGATVLGTGVNPGFVMDLLAAVLTNVCVTVDEVVVHRTNDLTPYGPTVLMAQGVGLSPESFRDGVVSGEVVGHIGFPASVALVAAALGWEIDRVDETRDPIVSSVPRSTPFVDVAPGEVAGCRHTATAVRNGRAVITLVHPQQVRPEAEGVATEDRIEIRGEPGLAVVSRPEIPGGIATAALAVNTVARVVAAPPGLTSMLHLPAAPRQPSTVGAAPVPAGTRVELHRVVLEPGERAENIPPETAAVPLELRVGGTLVEPASVGAPAAVITAAGRRQEGTLVAVDPAYDHGFGPPVPELTAIGAELRDLVARGRP